MQLRRGREVALITGKKGVFIVPSIYTLIYHLKQQEYVLTRKYRFNKDWITLEEAEDMVRILKEANKK
jgi:hypothetical protein